MSEAAIEVLHLGSASRDLTDADPRGWRLGGGVTYAALTTARLGLQDGRSGGRGPSRCDGRTSSTCSAEAGVELHVVPLAESPVFRNVEAPGGRVQLCAAPGEPLPIVDLPADVDGQRLRGRSFRSPRRSARHGHRPSRSAPSSPWVGRAGCATWSPDERSSAGRLRRFPLLHRADLVGREPR